MRRPLLLGLLLITPAVLLAGAGPPGGARVQDPAPAQGKAPKELSPGQSCLTSKCHQDRVQGAVVHPPVENRRCRQCHRQPDARRHEFAAITDQPGLCSGCHDLKRAKHPHEPFVKGQCTACHDPHRSAAKGLLVEEHPARFCAKCHEKALDVRNAPFVHRPVATEACTVCHSPHGAEQPKLLVAPEPAACLQCHEEMARQLESAAHWHGPVSKGCTICHDPHSGEHRYQLPAEPKDMCLRCHETKKRDLESARVYHGALNSEEGCKSCHATHASRFPMLLDEPVMDLCLKCHDEEQKRPDGSTVAAVGKVIASSRYLHGPIREKSCTGCHDPHGSRFVNLLVERYPEKFYAPFDPKLYALCFRCHDERMVTAERTTTLTGFRDGDRNLHYVHVNRRKGRTCRACHLPHGSNLPMHLAEKVPFGAWKLPIDHRPTPTGGSCAPGCHKPKTYDNGGKRLPVESAESTEPAAPRRGSSGGK